MSEPSSITHVHGEQFSMEWSQRLWDMLKDDGVWGIPRSGLMFRKNVAQARFVLYDRLPYRTEMPWTREQHLQFQDDDIEVIRTVFASLGIEVVDETHSRKVEGEVEGPG